MLFFGNRRALDRKEISQFFILKGLQWIAAWCAGSNAGSFYIGSWKRMGRGGIYWYDIWSWQWYWTQVPINWCHHPGSSFEESNHLSTAKWLFPAWQLVKKKTWSVRRITKGEGGRKKAVSVLSQRETDYCVRRCIIVRQNRNVITSSGNMINPLTPNDL
jgi:hypothetical protein